jgi:hypothetical protein
MLLTGCFDRFFVVDNSLELVFRAAARLLEFLFLILLIGCLRHYFGFYR